jgi:hypothetical protein
MRDNEWKEQMSGMPPDRAAPRWPMLLQQAGEPDVRIVRDQDEWNLDPELRSRKFQPDDRLIDSSGIEYRPSFAQGRNAVVRTGRRYASAEVQSIANRHLTNVGAEPGWLAEHLKEIGEGQRIRAIILYLSKLAAAADASESAADADDED